MWGELSSECGASCLGASFLWGELSWGELSLGRVVLIPTGRGSNQGPLGPKSDALTTAPLRHLSARLLPSSKKSKLTKQAVNIYHFPPMHLCLLSVQKQPRQ